MKRNAFITTLGIAATMATALVPTMANADLQNNKNNARNLAIVGVAVAGLGILNHNAGATVLGAAGALMGESQYQRDQNIENSYNCNDGNYRGWNSRWNDRDHRDYGNRYR